MGAKEIYSGIMRRSSPVLACLFLLVLPAAAAGAYCSAPSLPYCVSGGGGFADERAADRCRSQLEAYLYGLERQANCLRLVAEEEARQRIEEGRREVEELRDEGRKALARFECKARGGTC